MKKVLFSFLVALLVVSCSTAEKKHKQQADLFYTHGTEYLIKKDYTAALKHLIKAKELAPNRSDILTNLGMAYYFKGKNETARFYLKEAIQKDKNNTDARLNLATIALNEGKTNEAEAQYKEVLKDLTYQHNYRTFYNLGLIAKSKGQLQKAASLFKQSIEVEEKYCPSHFELGLIYRKQQEYKKALESFNMSANGTCFNQPAPHFYQGLALIDLKRWQSARIKLEEVINRFADTSYAPRAQGQLVRLRRLEVQTPLYRASSDKPTEEFKNSDSEIISPEF